jgi:hypothetical protein
MQRYCLYDWRMGKLAVPFMYSQFGYRNVSCCGGWHNELSLVLWLQLAPDNDERTPGYQNRQRYSGTSHNRHLRPDGIPFYGLLRLHYVQSTDALTVSASPRAEQKPPVPESQSSAPPHPTQFRHMATPTLRYRALYHSHSSLTRPSTLRLRTCVDDSGRSISIV